jgi:large subunit ribosomal protein L25
MAEVTLSVARREEQGKNAARRLRKDGKVPAVVYGGGREPVAITVDSKAIRELIAKSEHGIRSIFLLELKGADKKRHAMIKDVKVDPLNGQLEHIDFVRVIMDQKVKVTVPVRIVGLADGVKNGGGILEFQVRELHVETLPGSIPDTFEVDVTSMAVHDVVRIGDIEVAEGIEVLDDPERVVVSIGLPRAEVSAEVTEEAEAAEPELIKKGKAEEDEEK